MRTVSLVLGHCRITDIKGDIIGVDGGALFCVQNNLKMAIACGDFDSVNEGDLSQIQAMSKEFIKLNPIKDETDFTYAYNLCNDYDEIYVLGGLGRRRDHEYLIVRTATRDVRLIIKNDKNLIRTYGKGRHILKKEHTYCSFFPIEEAVITLWGFKYPLDYYRTSLNDDCLTSNEIIDEYGELRIESGRILVIQSSD